MPKATVQAALSTVAIDYVQEKHKGDEEMAEKAVEILNIGVMCILLTAPTFAIIIPRVTHLLIEEDGIKVLENSRSFSDDAVEIYRSRSLTDDRFVSLQHPPGTLKCASDVI